MAKVTRHNGMRVRGVKWRGMDELQAALAALPAEAKERVEREGVLVLATIAVRRMKQGLLGRTKTGRLMRGIAPGTIYRDGARIRQEIISGTRAGDKAGVTRGFVWRFVERGVRPHAVGKGSDLERKGRRKGRQTGAQHPGHAAYPFVRPALAYCAKIARRVYGKAIERAIARSLKQAPRGASAE